MTEIEQILKFVERDVRSIAGVLNVQASHDPYPGVAGRLNIVVTVASDIPHESRYEISDYAKKICAKLYPNPFIAFHVDVREQADATHIEAKDTMTPQDRCERMRDIVFEIIKRRYQETMPTRVEHKHGEFVIYLRDKLAAKFSIFRELPMYDPDRVSILCEAHSMHSKDIPIDMIARTVQTPTGKIEWRNVSEVIHYMTQNIMPEYWNTIADEFGMGVEQ